MKAITAKEAKRIGEATGFPITEGNGRTFYATTEDEDGVYEFDSKRERDEFVESCNNKDNAESNEIKFTEITVDGVPFETMYEALKEVAKAAK